MAEPYKPKIIPGKVAVCKYCGGYSNDLGKCTSCKRILPEGTKIMADPDYKPSESEKKLITNVGQNPGDLRNIRIQQKNPRKKTQSDEPECIALSSDEDEGDDDDGAEAGGGDKTGNEDLTSAATSGGDKDSNSGPNSENSGENKGKKEIQFTDQPNRDGISRSFRIFCHLDFT